MDGFISHNETTDSQYRIIFVEIPMDGLSFIWFSSCDTILIPFLNELDCVSAKKHVCTINDTHIKHVYIIIYDEHHVKCTSFVWFDTRKTHAHSYNMHMYANDKPFLLESLKFSQSSTMFE